MNIGERIKLARKKAGLTQQELADRVGDLTKQSISKYETGKSIPSSGVLLRLGKALDVTIDFLIRPSALTLDAAKFRKRANVRARDLARIEADVIDVLERQLTLERIVGDQPRHYDGPRGIPVVTLEDAEHAAMQLREQWSLGIDPIADLTNLLEDHSVRILIIEQTKGFDGVQDWIQGEIPVIVVAAGAMGDRQRFTMAHELGHLILATDRAQGKRFREKAADRFAGAFLIPRKAVLACLGEKRTRLSRRELHTFKHLYGASMQCWMHRAYDCGVIDEKLYVNMCKYARKDRWQDGEPGTQVKSETPQLFSQLLERALAEAYISESRAAELAGESLLKFRQSRLELARETG